MAIDIALIALVVLGAIWGSISLDFWDWLGGMFLITLVLIVVVVSISVQG